MRACKKNKEKIKRDKTFNKWIYMYHNKIKYKTKTMKGNNVIVWMTINMKVICYGIWSEISHVE